MNESTELVLVIDVPGIAPIGKTIGPVVEFWKPWNMRQTTIMRL